MFESESILFPCLYFAFYIHWDICDDLNILHFVAILLQMGDSNYLNTKPVRTDRKWCLNVSHVQDVDIY